MAPSEIRNSPIVIGKEPWRNSIKISSVRRPTHIAKFYGIVLLRAVVALRFEYECAPLLFKLVTERGDFIWFV
jgi:hypothetical protein